MSRRSSSSPTRRSAARRCSRPCAPAPPRSEAHFVVVAPLTGRGRARHLRRGRARRRAAPRRRALAELARLGLDARGEVVDPDPFSATMDAVARVPPDEIIISTHPETRSGWLRRDLLERVARPPGCPSSTSSPTSTPRACRRRARSWSPTRRRRATPLLGRSRPRPTSKPHRVHRRRPAGGGDGRAPRGPRRLTRSSRPARGRPRRRRDHRRPRPLHGDPQRPAVLPRGRDRDLDLPGHPLGLAARRPRSSACAGPRPSRWSTSSVDVRSRGSAAPDGSRLDRPPPASTTARPRPTAPRGSSPSCSGCCSSSSPR